MGVVKSGQSVKISEQDFYVFVKQVVNLIKR